MDSSSNTAFGSLWLGASLPAMGRCLHVGEEAVLGANVVLTASTKIIDVTGSEERIYKGFVPPRADWMTKSLLKPKAEISLEFDP